jgi:hypothetical protein
METKLTRHRHTGSEIAAKLATAEHGSTWRAASRYRQVVGNQRHDVAPLGERHATNSPAQRCNSQPTANG